MTMVADAAARAACSLAQQRTTAHVAARVAGALQAWHEHPAGPFKQQQLTSILSPIRFTVERERLTMPPKAAGSHCLKTTLLFTIRPAFSLRSHLCFLELPLTIFFPYRSTRQGCHCQSQGCRR
jgi:hypothetical protein